MKKAVSLGKKEGTRNGTRGKKQPPGACTCSHSEDGSKLHEWQICTNKTEKKKNMS